MSIPPAALLVIAPNECRCTHPVVMMQFCCVIGVVLVERALQVEWGLTPDSEMAHVIHDCRIRAKCPYYLIETAAANSNRVYLMQYESLSAAAFPRQRFLVQYRRRRSSNSNWRTNGKSLSPPPSCDRLVLSIYSSSACSVLATSSHLVGSMFSRVPPSYRAYCCTTSYMFAPRRSLPAGVLT